jgi:hypothetical protein
MADLGGGTSGYPGALDTQTDEGAGDNTDRVKVNGIARGVVQVQAELGTDPAGAAADVKTFLQQEHTTLGKHTLKVPHNFYQDNVAASQSAVALTVVGPATGIDIEMPWAGSIVGISAQVVLAEARTAGTLTVDATVNGVASGLQAVLNGSNTQHHAATQAIDVDTFSAGDRIGVDITTDAGWLPVSADLLVIVYVSFN